MKNNFFKSIQNMFFKQSETTANNPESSLIDQDGLFSDDAYIEDVLNSLEGERLSAQGCLSVNCKAAR